MIRLQQTIEISQLQFDKIFDVPVCASCRFSGAGSEETVAVPQLQLVEKSLFPDVQVAQFPQTSESLGAAPCGVTVHRRSGTVCLCPRPGGHVHRDMTPHN